MVFKEEPESEGFDDDYDPENNGGDSDYEPERKPRKRSAAANVRKPKTELQNDEGGGGDGCDSKSAAKVRFSIKSHDCCAVIIECCDIVAEVSQLGICHNNILDFTVNLEQ